MSAAKKVELVSDRMSYIIQRGRWCHIIVLNVQIDDVKDSFYEELEHVFNEFPKYHMDIFKLTIWNESLHKISNDN
jgi:hypothetical protein